MRPMQLFQFLVFRERYPRLPLLQHLHLRGYKKKICSVASCLIEFRKADLMSFSARTGSWLQRRMLKTFPEMLKLRSQLISERSCQCTKLKYSLLIRSKHSYVFCHNSLETRMPLKLWGCWGHSFYILILMIK